MAVIIYIAGYGRSGSTVLDMLLGSDDHAIGLSELTHVFGYWSNDLPCSCGKRIRQCEMWKKVFRKAGVEDEQLAKQLDRATRRIETTRYG